MSAIYPYMDIYAQDTMQRDRPVVTPAQDVDVIYELTSLLGDATSHQHMHWQVHSLRQRLDPMESRVYMVSSWKDKTLLVVDESRRRFSVMPIPGTQQLSPPGQEALQGDYLAFGKDNIANENCTLWRTRDIDARPVDVCYSPDGILLAVWTEGRPTVRAMAVHRTPQADSLFKAPKGFKGEAPQKP